MMAQLPLEVGEILRQYGPAFLEAYGDSISFEQRQVIEDLAACRTPARGGHLYECDACGHPLVLYNSCLNRHCPLCQAGDAADWLDSRLEEVLPVAYFHIVFTLPGLLAPLALQNKAVVYDILLRAASQTLLQIGADPKHLGAKIGFLAILHTWGQSLLHHPHVHCVVTGGGLSPDRSRWLSTRPGYFAPVKVLSRLFRGKLLAFLEEAFDNGELAFHGSIAHLANVKLFRKLINSIRRKELVVHAKEPHGSPQQVLKYLARYTHRVAISNSRLISIDDGQVTFRWKDYEHGGRWGTTKLDATEFIRRFLLHVLPKGFVRIRSYGLLANRYKAANLEVCRQLLGATTAVADSSAEGGEETEDPGSDDTGRNSARLCPECKQGRMVRVRKVAPAAWPRVPVGASRRANST